MKKYVALVLVLVMLCTIFAGCKNESAAEAPQTTPVESAEKETAEQSAEEVALEGDLTYITWMTKGEDQMLMDGFMAENPGVNLEMRTFDGANYAADVNTLCMAGDVPDVLAIQPEQVPDLVKNGYIQPIDGIPGVEVQKNNPTVNDLLSVDGKTYGFAVMGDIGSEYCYYNKAFFEENNLSIPTTLEEFDVLCQTIKDLGVDPIIVPGADLWCVPQMVMNRFYHTVVENGGTIAVEKALLNGEMKLSDLYGDMYRALEEYYKKGYISEGGVSMKWETATQYFIDGNAAMIAMSSHLASSEPRLAAPDFEIGSFAFPGIPDENGKCYAKNSVGYVMALSAHSKNPEAAQALFEYLIREDVVTAYLTERGNGGVNILVPTRPEIADAREMLMSEPFVLLPNFGFNGMPAGWNANYTQYIADIFSGADVDDLLARLDAEFEAVTSTLDLQEYIDKLG